ncbi:helix-turn-helix transcriptional regulator [uncultured Merdimonas sp.]|uniref:helix-turn-helix domain-containing protein n=1 Tax=uncultured Merdimonas sp. TaxID=2023269 RepID=UPI00320A4BA4
MRPSPQEADRLLGKRLQQFRKEQHISQSEIADYCQVSLSYISTMERGIHRCNPMVLMGYSQKLNISLDTLCKLDPPDSQARSQILPELSEMLSELSEQQQNALLCFLKTIKDN